jgi:hypothetical protein
VAAHLLGGQEIGVDGAGHPSRKPGAGRPAARRDLAEAPRPARDLKAAGQSTVAVLISGRPLMIEHLLPALDGLMMAYLLSSEGGAAVPLV